VKNASATLGGKRTLLVALVILAARTLAAQAASFETLYNFKGGADGANPRPR
jgi:hypothetical protein